MYIFCSVRDFWRFTKNINISLHFLRGGGRSEKDSIFMLQNDIRKITLHYFSPLFEGFDGAIYVGGRWAQQYIKIIITLSDILSARRFTEDCKLSGQKGGSAHQILYRHVFSPPISSWRGFMALILNLHWRSIIPTRLLILKNSMRRREDYQRRRESLQRGILPPLALQR